MFVEMVEVESKLVDYTSLNNMWTLHKPINLYSITDYTMIPRLWIWGLAQRPLIQQSS